METLKYSKMSRTFKFAFIDSSIYLALSNQKLYFDFPPWLWSNFSLINWEGLICIDFPHELSGLSRGVSGLKAVPGLWKSKKSNALFQGVILSSFIEKLDVYVVINEESGFYINFQMKNPSESSNITCLLSDKVWSNA